MHVSSCMPHPIPPLPYIFRHYLSPLSPTLYCTTERLLHSACNKGCTHQFNTSLRYPQFLHPINIFLKLPTARQLITSTNLSQIPPNKNSSSIQSIFIKIPHLSLFHHSKPLLNHPYGWLFPHNSKSIQLLLQLSVLLFLLPLINLNDAILVSKQPHNCHLRKNFIRDVHAMATIQSVQIPTRLRPHRHDSTVNQLAGKAICTVHLLPTTPLSSIHLAPLLGAHHLVDHSCVTQNRGSQYQCGGESRKPPQNAFTKTVAYATG